MKREIIYANQFKKDMKLAEGEVIYRIPAFNDLRQQPIRKSNRNARDRDRLNITCSFAVLSSRETMACIPSLR